MITYGQLLDRLKELTPEQLEMNVTIITISQDEDFGLYNLSDTMVASEVSNLPEIDTELFTDTIDESNLPFLIVR